MAKKDQKRAGKNRKPGKSIDDYREKRDFGKTPEPPPGPVRSGDEPVFVVHRHDASRLHYDLRLEMEGVLRSWAVPKGFSYDPGDKHLAVRTEDHPMEYTDFHGVIPKGEYGAGSMTIWDRGRYEVVKAPSAPEAIEAGELKVILRGRKLRGEWHLVKTKQGEDTWLLFKSRDRYAGPPRDTALGVDLALAVERDLPDAPERMEPAGESEPFSDPAWVFEMRFEGRRVFAEKRGDAVRVHGLPDEVGDLAAVAPGVARGLAALGAENALLDGVLVVVDEHERPSAERLAARLAARGGDGDGEVVLYAFDLLHYEEFDLRSLPLIERKGALRAVLAHAPDLLFVDHVPGDGESLVEACAAAGLPGVIAKRADAPYEEGPSDAWRAIPVAGGAAAAEADAVSRALGRRAGADGGSRVKLTNLEKVYWPAEGYTKGDLLAYYDRIAPFLLPHLAERPVHMNRFPDGIEGKSFYQKDTKEQFPDWIETELVESSKEDKEGTRYPVIGDRDALLFLVNLGSIDMHPWLSRRGSLESPDFAVIDLDPKGAPFEDVKTIAREVGEILRAIGLRPLLKTSGSTGLHVYVPLQPGYTYDHTKAFCEGVARLVASRLPKIATVERVVGNREGKVYVDFLQNRRGQTLVPPYSVRPVRGATVSTPLAWDELTDELTLAQFTILTVPPRVEERGDLFADALTDGQDLLPAIERLGELARSG